MLLLAVSTGIVFMLVVLVEDMNDILELSKTKNEGDKISLVFYLSRHHKHACVFPLGMA